MKLTCLSYGRSTIKRCEIRNTDDEYETSSNFRNYFHRFHTHDIHRFPYCLCSQNYMYLEVASKILLHNVTP